MSDRPTPETDEQCYDCEYRGDMGGRFTADPGKLDPYGDHVSADFARKLERQRDEARELARDLLSALKDQHNFSRHFSNSSHNSSFAKMQRDTESLLAKAKEVLP